MGYDIIKKFKVMYTPKNKVLFALYSGCSNSFYCTVYGGQKRDYAWSLYAFNTVEDLKKWVYSWDCISISRYRTIKTDQFYKRVERRLNKPNDLSEFETIEQDGNITDKASVLNWIDKYHSSDKSNFVGNVYLEDKNHREYIWNVAQLK